MEGKSFKLTKLQYFPAILTVIIAVFLCGGGITYKFLFPKKQVSSANFKNQIDNLLGEKKYDEAAALLEKYKVTSEDAEFVCNANGIVNFARKKYELAANSYQDCAKILGNSKKSAFYQNLIGNCYREMNDYNKAIASYQEAVTNNPYGQTAWVNLISTYLLSGEKAEAADSAKTALEKIPDSQEIKNLLAKTRE